MEKADKEKWVEKEFKEISGIISGEPNLSHYHFLRIRNFKLNNFTPETEERIKKVTQVSFNLAEQGIKEINEEKQKESIKILTDKSKGIDGRPQGLEGVGIPIASAILAMRFPEDYVIIDSVVIEGLQ